MPSLTVGRPAPLDGPLLIAHKAFYLIGYAFSEWLSTYSLSKKELKSAGIAGKSPKTAIVNLAGSDVSATAPNQATH